MGIIRHPIGIGITTHNRWDVLAETLKALDAFGPYGAVVVVVDDGSDEAHDIPNTPFGVQLVRHDAPQGIPAAKNRCIEELMRAGCDHLFLFDDDTRPAQKDWWKTYLVSPEPHLQYCWTRFSVDNKPVPKMIVAYQDERLTGYTWSMGCMLYVTREVIERVGGMDLRFGRGMEEHAEWCCVPETKVLTEALEWVPIGSLSVGDKVIGFEEYGSAPAAGRARRWCEAKVTATEIISAQTFTLKTNGAPDVVCTAQHKWLVRRHTMAANHIWLTTEQLRPGDKILYLSKPWERDNSRDAGYVAGIYDGEGWITQCRAMFGQNPGLVLDKTTKLLRDHGFDLCVRKQQPRGNVQAVCINGGVAETMRFMGTFHPERLAEKFLDHLYAKTLSHLSVVEVESVEPAGVRDVVALETSSGTLMVEGMFSHNSQRIHNCGFTTFAHQDVTGSSELIYASDEHYAVARSFTAPDRRKLLRRNDALRKELLKSTRYVEYRRPRDVVLTSYFTSRPDEQRPGHTWPADAKVLFPLTDSVNRVADTPVTLLTDIGEAAPVDIEVDFIPAVLSPYQQRWLSQWQWLRRHPEVDRVWVVDATDVQMLRNPFPHMADGVLYVGSESKTVGCEWMRKHVTPATRRWWLEHQDDRLLNCGVVGGSRGDVMRLCRAMVDMYVYDRLLGHNDPLAEMVYFNKAAREHTRWHAGPDVTTDFKRNQDNGTAFWKHK